MDLDVLLVVGPDLPERGFDVRHGLRLAEVEVRLDDGPHAHVVEPLDERRLVHLGDVDHVVDHDRPAVREARYQAKTRNDNGKILDSEGNRYQDTRNFFLLSATHPEDGVLLYPMTSTGIPASKKALAKSSAIKVKDAAGKMVQVPMYSRVWELKVDFVQSPKGSYFKVSDFVDKGWISAAVEAPVKAAFDEAQAYIKNKVPIVEAGGHDDEPDWVKQ